MHDIDDYPEADVEPGLLVYRYDATLFFANAEDFRERALAAVGEFPGAVQWFGGQCRIHARTRQARGAATACDVGGG